MIGLIFGETNFPIQILKKIKKRHLKYLIIDLTKRKKFKKDKHSSVGLVKAVNRRKRLLSYLKKNNLESYKNVINKLNLRK